jgi:hypothetical protein
MTDERITTVEHVNETGDTVTRTTHVAGDGASKGGFGWMVIVVLLVAVAAGAYLFSQTSASEVAKDNAIAQAAGNVGEAANSVGEAASDVGEAATDAINEAAD